VDADAAALEVLRTLATQQVVQGPPFGTSYTWVPDPAKVHAEALAMAARAAFTEADRWAGKYRDGAFPYVEPDGTRSQGSHDAARRIATTLSQELAREVLADAREKRRCETADPESADQWDALAKAFEEHARDLWLAAGMADGSPRDNDAATERDPATGLLRWDAALVTHLKGIGKVGGELADTVHKRATDPLQLDWTRGPVPAAVRLWGLWLPFSVALVDAAAQSVAMLEERLPDGAKCITDPTTTTLEGPTGEPVEITRTQPDDVARMAARFPPGAYRRELMNDGPPPTTRPIAWRSLCRALWFDVVRPQVGRVPAMRTDYFNGLRRSMTPQIATESSNDGGHLNLISPRDGIVGYLDLRVINALHRKNGPEIAAALASPAGHRLISMAGTMIARSLALRQPTPYRTVLPGRSQMRADLGGIKTDKWVALLNAGTAFRASGPGWSIGALFTFAEYKASAGRPAMTVLNWNDDLFKPLGLLTPLPEADHARPWLAHKLAGKVEHATWWIYGLMQTRSRELAAEGSVRITESDWRIMQGETGLSAKYIDRLRGFATPEGAAQERWTNEGTRAWIREVDPGRYRLTDQNAHRFLVEQGERREHRSAGGKMASKARAGKLRDRGKGRKT